MKFFLILLITINSIGARNVDSLLIASKKGDVLASAVLGEAYLKGYYALQPDTSTAYTFFEKSTTNAITIFNIGKIYYDLSSKDTANLLFTKFHSNADLNDRNDNYELYYNLGLAYEFEFGVKQNYLTAIQHYKKIKTHPSNTVAVRISNCFHLLKEYDSSLVYLKKAVLQNNTDAMFNLAHYYLNGISIEKDSISAFHLVKHAANKGHHKSQITYAHLLYLKEEYQEAYFWYSKSSQSINSLKMLAKMEANGLGTQKNLDTACEKYFKIISHGDKSSIKSIQNTLKESYLLKKSVVDTIIHPQIKKWERSNLFIPISSTVAQVMKGKANIHFQLSLNYYYIDGQFYKIFN